MAETPSFYWHWPSARVHCSIHISALQCPLRRDIVERAARDALRVTDPTLEIIGNLSTLMGLLALLLTYQPLSSSGIFPCTTFVNNQPVALGDIIRNNVKAVLPHLDQFIQLDDILVDGKGLRLLLLSPGRDSQQRKLNFYGSFNCEVQEELVEVLAAP